MVAETEYFQLTWRFSTRTILFLLCYSLLGSSQGKNRAIQRLTNISEECLPGYYCEPGSVSHQQHTCPAGSYCSAGTTMPIKCPSGTFSNTTGLSSISECTSCTPGSYCRDHGLTAEQGVCRAGYYCPKGSISSRAIVCPSGFHCPSGSAFPQPCPAGQFTSRRGKSSCELCPPGFFCLPLTFPPRTRQHSYRKCPAGHYCPSGTGRNWRPCPVGTYSNRTGIYKVNQCILCPGGFHCDSEGQTSLTGPCAPGYYCQSGVNVAQPTPLTRNVHSESTGGHTGIDTICPKGHFCALATNTPLPYPSGVYQDKPGQSSCKICPSGHYCPDVNAEPIPCPTGTYNPTERAGNVESCLKCPTNSFNHLTGQTTCFTCGPESVQPKEGHDHCICLQTGQVFQPSDSHCVCAVRHQMKSDGMQECVRKLYDICRDAASRNQDGVCLTIKEWKDYCSLKVCASPADYQGFDRDLGLCLCRAAALDSVCDQHCRWLQRSRLQALCKGVPGLLITSRDGSKVEMPLNRIGRILNSRNALEQSQCPPHHKFIQPVYLVEMSEKGFLGVYDPDPRKLKNFLEMSLVQLPSLDSTMSPENATIYVMSTSPKDPEVRGSSVHQSLGTLFSGIFNPIVCINSGTIILFTVSRKYYPVYDSANLYNTDSDFDWGAFRDLVEELKLASSSSLLFTYRFNQPGVHVFQMSSNPEKRMYVRVMPIGGQCYEEGPFFPTMPRHFIRMGIRRTQDLQLKPDWLLISSLMVASAATVSFCMGLTLLCRKGSWPKKAVVAPRYQQLQKRYNFDDYSSKGAAIIAVKKIHRSLHFEERNEDDDRKEDSVSKNNEFGDYDQQIDLEFFNTSTFYQILLKQSLAVSVRLSQHKKEVKTLYQKIMKVTESLRELWMERMNFAGRCIVNRTDMEMYEKMCSKVRLEIQRRKDVGQEFEEILNKQQQLLQADWNSREEHHVTFSVALREVVRLLEEHADHVENRTVLNNPIDQRDYEQVEALLLQMTDAITNECQRLRVWSVLGEGTGAQLVKKETLKVLSKEELIGADGAIIDHSLLQVDQLTGLLTPSADAVMILANKYTRPVPGNFFLHPHTGRVLPMNGNVCYDSARSCLLPVTDSGPGAFWQSEEYLVPYVPHSLCPETNIPLKLQLANLPRQCDVKLRGPIPDAETGIKVPTLAMTIHLQTSLIHPLGGTYVSPVTRMLAPIEIGAPMVCEKTGWVVPIIGVGLNTKTGAVIPLGGVPNSSNNPMILGECFTESLSGRSARISGACVQETQLVPHAGGYQALLDGAMLANEVQVLEALKDYKDSLVAQGSEASLLHQKWRATLEDALDGLMRARSRSWVHIIHTMHNLERQRKEAADLADTGGNVGMISFAGTGLQIPAVVGMHIPDPGGSDLEVPILGVDYDRSTGRLVPLAGTMEDPDGKGLIPISLGARSIDSITGEIGPVVGARIDPKTRIVVPVLQSSGGPMRQNLDGEMLKALEEELHCRREHWRHQQQKEKGLFIALKSFLQEVSYCKFTKVEEKVRTLGEILALLQDCAQSEAQRRHVQESNFSSLMPTDVIVLVSQVDKEEVEQQMLLLAAAQTMLEKMKQFTAKMSQDEAQPRGQLQKAQEALYQQAEEASPLGYPQLKSLLTQEFQQNIMNQWTCLDMMYIRLDHLRDLAELCGLEAKCVLSGHVYYFGDYQLTRSKNADLFHGSPDVSNRKMVPLIKQLINILETDRNIILSPGTLNLVSSKEKNWSKMLLKSPLFKLLAEINEHLKASPEEREVLQVKEDQQRTIQSKVKYQETGRPYMDIMDATCTCEGKLVPLTPEKISVTELAIYRFGNFIAKLVKRVINVPEINLLLASSLPMNNYTHNAFRNSFFYQHSCKMLFIRRQRLASVGDFSLVLVHCLAHLAAGELCDDSNALFLEHFHQALKGIFKEIFFSRFCASPTLRGHEPRDNLFQKDSPEIYMDAISDLLNIKLNDSETTTVFRELPQDGETRKENGASTQSKDQQDVKMNECQSEIEKNNGVCLEPRSKLDQQEVEEKLDDLTMELAAFFDLELKEEDRATFHPKKRALLREIEELEAELDRREK